MRLGQESTALSVVFTNIRSVLNKRDELQNFIESAQADVIVLTETWLNPDIEDNELFDSVASFNVYRCDRVGRRGGGVLIAVRNTLSSFRVNVSTCLETLWVSIDSKHSRNLFGVCYRPPSSDSSFVDKLRDVLSELFVSFPKCNVTLLGDFNFPSIDWSASVQLCCPSSDARRFHSVCLDFYFSQLVTFPTRVIRGSSTILDLVLTNNPDLVSDISCIDGLSDHKLLHFYVTLPICTTKRSVKLIKD